MELSGVLSAPITWFSLRLTNFVPRRPPRELCKYWIRRELGYTVAHFLGTNYYARAYYACAVCGSHVSP